MEWTLTEDPQPPPFSYMDFDFEHDSLFDFGAADDDSPQFELAPFDITQTPFSNAFFHHPQAIDPALVSPVPDTEPPRYGPVGNASAKFVQQQQQQQQQLQRTRRRGAAGAKYAPPHLTTDLSEGSRLVHGQITPPSSDTASPPQAPLDTIDPTAVMPMYDTSSKPDNEALDLSAAPRLFSPADPVPASPPKEPAPEPAAQAFSSAPATTDPPPKPKSKRGRKKKILAPAARDAQRARTLARNRAAAQRCRQRKKVEHAALESKARTLTKERARLTTLVGSLRDELLGLKGAMLSHAGCAEMDGNVARYVREQRAMLMAGMPMEGDNAESSKKLLDKEINLFGEEDEGSDESEEYGDDNEEDEDEDEEDGDGDDDEGDDVPMADPLPSPQANAAIAHRTRSRGQRRK